MRRWLAMLFAAMTGASAAQEPQINADQLRFETQALPLTMNAWRLWLGVTRGGASTNAAMTLVAPGVTLNAQNHAAYAPKIAPMIDAIGKRLASANADKSDNETGAAARFGTFLARSEWQALLDDARGAKAATQSMIDTTLAMALLNAAGIEERTSPEAARLWSQLRRLPSAHDPGAGKRPLTAAAPAAEAAFNRLRKAISEYESAQRKQAAVAALTIGRELYPNYASGTARRIGTPAKINAFIEELRMPEFARFYAGLWGDMRISEIRLKVEALARTMGWPDQWDADGTRRERATQFVTPRLNKLGADAPDSEPIAEILSELISDADLDWMRAEWKSERGAKLMPSVERVMIASFWRRGISESRIWQGFTPNSEAAATPAQEALRKDPNARDPIFRRLEPLEQKAKPMYDRIVEYQLTRTRAAIDQVFKRDDKEIRAYLQSIR